jgi:DNA-binding CsgD family transcriptional regulator
MHRGANRPVVELRGVDSSAIETLSQREREVLSLAASGYLDKEIVKQLGVSPNTLRTYWTRIRAKIGDVPRSALAVAYATEPAAHAVVEAVGADWEVDLERWTYRRLSPRPPMLDLEVGEETSFDDAVALVHPEDAPNLLRLIEDIRTGDQTELTFEMRVVTPTGIETTSSFARIDRDEAGRAYRLTGTRSRNVDLRATGRPTVEVGYWERDLRSGKFTADAAFCAIFDIDPAEPNLRDLAMARFHPDERELTSSFVDSTIRSEKRHARATHRLRRPDGSYGWIATELRIEYDENGPARALGVVMAFDRD